MTKKEFEIEIGINVKTIMVALISVLILIYIFNIINISQIKIEKSRELATSEEETRSANLQLTKIIDSSCTNCFDIEEVVDFIEENNVKITKTESLEFASIEAKSLIKKFDIQKVPALLVSGEVNKPSIADLWIQVNGKELKGNIYIESIPPYRNVTSGGIEGLVNLTMITDNSCSKCYNVSIHKLILLRFGISVVSESNYDISSTEGKQLLNKYNITKVPTIILSKEASVYPTFVQVWLSVGTIESDDQFVFRNVEEMGNYTNLSK